MKKLLPATAILLLIAAIGMILIQRSGRGLDTLPPKDSPANSDVPTLRNSPEKYGTVRARTRRPSLEESLPPGSKLIESKKSLGGVEVILADGSHISARGASVTASGISFEGPYEYMGAKGSALNSTDNGSVFLLARDGRSFKMIPAPGGTITTSTPLKSKEAEQAGRGDGDNPQN